MRIGPRQHVPSCSTRDGGSKLEEKSWKILRWTWIAHQRLVLAVETSKGGDRGCARRPGKSMAFFKVYPSWWEIYDRKTRRP